MSIRILYVLFLSIMFVFACKNSNKNTDENILAEVDGIYLYKTDLPEQLYNELGKGDNKEELKAYIDKWVEKQLTINEANKILSSSEKDKTELIEDYKNSLLIYDYQQKIIKEKLDSAVTDQDLVAFYNQNPQNFILKENIVKIRYIKINKGNNELSKIKNLMQNPNSINDSLLNLIAQKQAINFYINNNWLYLNDITKEIPLDENYDRERFLSNNKFIQIEENGVLYLLYIIDFMVKNKTSPIEFEKDKIKQIILYQRKLDFLKKHQKTILNKALDKGQVKYYVK